MPFTCEQLFDVAAEIERYPEFLPGGDQPGSSNARAIPCYVNQELALASVRPVRSQAVLLRPTRIDISSPPALQDVPLLVARGCYRAKRVSLSIEADLELSSSLLQKILTIPSVSSRTS